MSCPIFEPAADNLSAVVLWLCERMFPLLPKLSVLFFPLNDLSLLKMRVGAMLVCCIVT